VANKIKAFLNIVSIFIAIFMSTSAFADPVHGILMVVKGDVQIMQKDKITPAKVGAKVIPGDTIITKKDARAKLVMIDKNIINISPDSKFLLEKYEFNPEENKKGALLNVIYGKVRTTVNQKYDGEEHKFQVKTKSSVAGVRGTDFLVTFNQTTNTSKVVTFEGKVDVGAGMDSAGRILNPVSVKPGEFTVAATGTPPSQPMSMPQAEMNSLKQQTVADAPTKENNNNMDRPGADGEKKERTPSNDESKDKQNNGKSDDKRQDGDKNKHNDERQPSSEKQPAGERQPANGSTPPPPPGSVMDQMGEDASAPIVAKNNQLPPPPLVPVGMAPPPGATMPILAPIDPTLIQGKTNLIINLNPGP
jgi:hypothetical protein